jgi:hypothetical protein
MRTDKMLTPHSRKYRMPIATLPMLNGKIYAIWQPALINAALRSRDLSFIPFVVQSAQSTLRITDDTLAKVHGPDGEGKMIDELFSDIQKALVGDNLKQLNIAALKYIATQLDGLASGGAALEAQNLYVWVRKLMVFATTAALYGEANPLIDDPKLENDLWYERYLRWTRRYTLTVA